MTKFLPFLLIALIAIASSVHAQETVASTPMARTIILVRHGAYQADPGLLPFRGEA